MLHTAHFRSLVGSLSITILLIIGYKCEEHNNPADFFLDIIDCKEQAGKKRINYVFL